MGFEEQTMSNIPHSLHFCVFFYALEAFFTFLTRAVFTCQEKYFLDLNLLKNDEKHKIVKNC